MARQEVVDAATTTVAEDVDEVRGFWRALRSLDQLLTAEEVGALRRFNVTITQYIAMMGLSYSLGQSSAHMARCLGVTPQATHSLLRRLEAQDFIERVNDTYSETVKVNILTEGGRKVTDQADAALQEIEARRKKQLGSASYNRLLDLLSRVVRLNVIDGTREQVEAQKSLEKVVQARVGASVRHLNSHHASEIVAALKKHKLTASQYFVLVALEPGVHKTTSQIVSDSSVPQQSGSSAVLALDRAALIQSSPATHHVRLSLRSLAPDGVERRRASIESVREVEHEILRPLSPDQTTELANFVRHSLRILG